MASKSDMAGDPKVTHTTPQGSQGILQSSVALHGSEPEDVQNTAKAVALPSLGHLTCSGNLLRPRESLSG